MQETLPAALASPLASSSPSSSSPSSVPRTLTLQPVAFTHPPPHPPADPLSRLPTHPPTRSPTGAPARPPTDPRTQRPTRPPNHQTIHPPSSRADAHAGSGRQNSLFFLHMISICDFHVCFQYVSNCFLLFSVVVHLFYCFRFPSSRSKVQGHFSARVGGCPRWRRRKFPGGGLEKLFSDWVSECPP